MTERIIFLSLFLGSTAYLFFAQQLIFGTLRLPKSGFFPTIVGFIAIAIAFVLLLNQFHRKKVPIYHKVDWTKFIFILIGLFFYILLFNVTGYFIATFILLFYLFKIADTTGWLIPFLMALISSTLFHFIFKSYLAVTLP